MKHEIRYEIIKATPEDAEAMLAYLNQVGGESDNLLFGLNGFHHLTVKQEQEMIEQMNGSTHSAMLIAKVGNEIVSVGSIMGSPRERINHKGSIALSVKKAYWNAGIGQSMLGALIEHGRNVCGMTVISLEVRSDNEAAIHVYEKMGFRRIGTFEKYFRINGEYFGAEMMNLYLE